MKISKIRIAKFRGIKFSSILLPDHGVLIGDNNTGKSTVFEALDLTLGPDRLNRRTPINEHDFFKREYFNSDVDKSNPEIRIEVTVTDLDDEQSRRFHEYIEFWNATDSKLVSGPPLGAIDPLVFKRSLRVTFVGKYEEEDDDFSGKTYFTRSLIDGDPKEFRKADKRMCGFLYLRALRTGSRALSLEHGSLLDIILSIKELRLNIWENIITSLDRTDVAADPKIGVSGVLEGIQSTLNRYVPDNWGTAPRLKVSNLTREDLRKVISAFITDPASGTSLPYYRQGTGTTNLLVLSMLSMIAEGREGKVIFAMEEPETAIAPYSQKNIITEVRKLSSQALFTSHSPYVIEEFDINETIVLHKKSNCQLVRRSIELPAGLKLKRYRQRFKQHFCECLLTRQLVIAEGATEATAIVAAARRLSELNPAIYKPIEALGLAVLDADGESNIPKLAKMFKSLDKKVFVICDQQTLPATALITPHADTLFMHGETKTETVIVNQSHIDAKTRYLTSLVNDGFWINDFANQYPVPINDVDGALALYLEKNKGNWAVADFLAQCLEAEMPQFFKDTCAQLRAVIEPPSVAAPQLAAAAPLPGIPTMPGMPPLPVAP